MQALNERSASTYDDYNVPSITYRSVDSTILLKDEATPVRPIHAFASGIGGLIIIAIIANSSYSGDDIVMLFMAMMFIFSCSMFVYGILL